MVLDVVTVPRCEPERFGGLGRALLARAAREPEAHPLLLLAELTGESLLLGRHQRFSSCLESTALVASGLAVARRTSGGRVARVGEGTVGLLVALPALDALGSGPVPPDKVINRTVRGLLAGLTTLGARGGAHYFGRDFISADRQQLARVGQDTLGGAGLFEALIAVERSLELPAELDGYPEHSDSRVHGPPAATLAEHRGSALSFAELTSAVVEGFAAATGASPVSVSLPEIVAVELAPPVREDESGWSESGVADVPIGFAEALVRREDDHVAAVRLRGDFMASSSMLAELERSLVGAPLDFRELGSRIDAAFHQPGAFAIGLRELRVLADAILAAT